MKLIICSASIVLAITAMGAAEEPSSANYVMPACWHYLNSSKVDYFGQGRCIGLVEGLGYLANRCTPAGVTVRQAILVVATYIAGRPTRMHEDFKDLALEALRTAWPCK
jgi:hypothetical protein